MTRSNKALKIVGGTKNIGDEELRLWLKTFVEDNSHLNTVVLSREDHIGASRTALDAYINGTYFLPKPQGHGVNPANSKTEDKIRGYREKVEGTVRHGYQNSFIETRSWLQFQHACKTAIEENVIVVVYARPGIGKSRALLEYSTKKMTTSPIRILCSRNVTVKYFAQKIAESISIPTRGSIPELEDNISTRLKRNPRPLFVDQANYLDERSLGTVCQIWEQAKIPIVLIGTKDLYELFNTSRLTEDVRAQLSSRVAMHYPLMELSEAEVKSICRRVLGDRATDDAIAKLFNVTKGNHRHLDMVMPRVIELANRNAEGLENETITMEEIVDKATERIIL